MIRIDSIAPQLNKKVDVVGIDWVSRVPAVANRWEAIAFGNNTFVAVASTGTGDRTMHSQDGINWEAGTIIDGDYEDITYGAGLFVAVGRDALIQTSPDGITWTVRTAPVVTVHFESVTYGGGLFVIVADGGTGDRVATSPDGITWTARAAAVDNAWEGVTWGRGLFVAVCSNGFGNRVMSSADGITWATQVSAADIAWEGVAYGGGLFVAVAITGVGNRVMTSPDAVTWTSQVTPVDNNWRRVIWAAGLFVAVATGAGVGNRVMTSPDAVTWTVRFNPVDSDWNSLVFANNMIVAVARFGGGNRIMTSGTQEMALAPHDNIDQGGRSVQGGIVSGFPTGGNKGTGSINVENLYVNDVPIIMTNVISYLPGSQGFGTIIAEAYYQRIGNVMHLTVYFQAGIPTAVEAQISLPAGLTVDTARVVSRRMAGVFIKHVSVSTNGGVILIIGGDSYINFSSNTVLSNTVINPAVPQNGNSLGSTDNSFSLECKVPIAEWG